MYHNYYHIHCGVSYYKKNIVPVFNFTCLFNFQPIFHHFFFRNLSFFFKKKQQLNLMHLLDDAVVAYKTHSRIQYRGVSKELVRKSHKYFK